MKDKKGRIGKLILKCLLGCLAVIVLLFSALAFFGVYWQITGLSYDRAEDFIAAANTCDSAKFKSSDEAGAFEYRSKKCVFTKTLVRLNESENQEMKDLLEGKSLTCAYEKGHFDERWIDSWIAGIEDCEGELKEILGQLVMFV